VIEASPSTHTSQYVTQPPTLNGGTSTGQGAVAVLSDWEGNLWPGITLVTGFVVYPSTDSMILTAR